MRLRVLRILRTPRGQRPPDVSNTPSVTDGPQSCIDEKSETVVLTFEKNLEELRLSEASQLLIEREDRLFMEITEEEALKHHQEEVDKIAADYIKLKTLVEDVLAESLSVGLEAVSIETLSSAVKVICQEEEQYQLWKKKDQAPPLWRHSSWKVFHDTQLRSVVKGRLETPSTPPVEMQGMSSIQTDITMMGRQLKEDLLWVVDVLKECYPPQMDICNFYARLYHQDFSNRLKKIADFGLHDKDCTFVVRWVNEFYPGLLQKPELSCAIDGEALGKLLPKEVLEPLEEQYLNIQQSELTTYIGRVLEEAEQKWDKGEEPKREDGCYVSPVAYDIIQLINGMVTSAEKVVGDLHKAQSITCQLDVLIERFKNLQDNIIKQNRANSTVYIKANLGCIKQFRDVLVKQSHLFAEDQHENCLRVMAGMKQSAHTYLLSSVHDSLKPQYRKLGTNDWLNKSVFEKLMVSIERQIKDLQGSAESCHQELICQFHQDVTVEYVKRLLKGEVKLKDRERQHQAYMMVNNNAESLHGLFSRMGSKEEWLREILIKIAEVLKLQDLPAIQMQVVSLGSAFPDLSEKHVSALLKLKTNLNRADRKTVKETLTVTLKETSFNDALPFFSKVQVK